MEIYITTIKSRIFKKNNSYRRNHPNNERQLIIDEAFKKFEKDNSNMIDIRDLKGVFNASKHSKVISGEITQEQAFDEFSRNFNDHTGAGKIEQSEWNDY